MNLTRIVGLASAAVLTLTVAGCGTSEGSDQGTDVEHAMGSTGVTCEPERVVTLGQGATDSVLAMGITPVGVVQPWTDDWYDYLPDEVEEAEVVGTELEPDLEEIASLAPDLILGSKLRHEAIYDQLSEIAPTVFSDTIGVAWKENASLWASAMCRDEEGQEVLDAYEARATAIGDTLADAGRGDTEVSIIRFKPDQVRIYLTGFPGSVIRDTGLARPDAQTVADWEDSEQLIEISEERIPDMDGDVIFQMLSSDEYAQRGTKTVDEQIDRWTSTDLWQSLSAVEDGNVVTVNESHWNLGGGVLAANAMLEDVEAFLLDRE